jgi:hypothetical protein
MTEPSYVPRPEKKRERFSGSSPERKTLEIEERISSA